MKTDVQNNEFNPNFNTTRSSSYHLHRRCEGINADDLIFPGTNKNVLSPSNLNKKLKRWLKEAGINKDLHPHSLRGSSGTYLLDHDVPIEVVSRMFGHQNVSTTQNSTPLIQKPEGKRMQQKFAECLMD